MTTHSSILAWKMPWTEEPEGLQFLGSQRVGLDLGTRESFWISEKNKFLNKLVKVKVLVSQSSPILCNSKHCSMPGSSVHGIFQARILEWIAIPFSQRSS